MNNCNNPLKLTYNPQLFVGYKVNKPEICDCELVDKDIADNLLKQLLRLKVICESEIPEFNIPELNKAIEDATMDDSDDNVFNKAVTYVQETYCEMHLNAPYMLLGDVAELIKITTGKEVKCQILAKYTK